MSKTKFVTYHCFSKWVKHLNAQVKEIDELLKGLRDRVTRLEQKKE